MSQKLQIFGMETIEHKMFKILEIYFVFLSLLPFTIILVFTRLLFENENVCKRKTIFTLVLYNTFLMFIYFYKHECFKI